MIEGCNHRKKLKQGYINSHGIKNAEKNSEDEPDCEHGFHFDLHSRKEKVLNATIRRKLTEYRQNITRYEITRYK